MLAFVTGKWGTQVISHGPVVLCFSILKDTFFKGFHCWQTPFYNYYMYKFSARQNSLF